MTKKIFWVVLIVCGVIASVLVMVASYDGIRAMIGVAQADPSAANYTAYNYALGASPWWIFFIPFIVGGVAIVMVLRQPEGR